MNENGISGFEFEELPLGRPAKTSARENAPAPAGPDAILPLPADMEPSDAVVTPDNDDCPPAEQTTPAAEESAPEREDGGDDAAEAEGAAEQPEGSAEEQPEGSAEEPSEEADDAAAAAIAPIREKTMETKAKKPAGKQPAKAPAKKKPVPGKKPAPSAKRKKEEGRPQPAAQQKEEAAKWKMPGILKFLVWLAFTLAAGLALAYFAWMCAGDVFALSKPDRTVEITITQQDTLDDVIDAFVEEGLVEYEWLFRLYCALANAEEKFSVGTFTLNNIYDYNALLKGVQAHSGTRETTEVTIPEGYTCKQIFEALAEAGVCTVEELEAAASGYMFEYEFLQHLPYGEANRLEGYLFPDTYEFYINDTPERVLSKFMDNFSWKFEEDLLAEIAVLNETLAAKMRENGFSEERIAESALDLHDVVIVASLIERETGGASESSKIASVIYNRLTSERYPLLEIDASVRYGLDKWEGVLSNADLAKDTPYNTRKNPGLPAGPISNPGLDSIRAALYPRNTDYYFYVLTPDGSHHFSETYYEHQDFIEEMRKSGN